MARTLSTHAGTHSSTLSSDGVHCTPDGLSTTTYPCARCTTRPRQSTACATGHRLLRRCTRT